MLLYIISSFRSAIYCNSYYVCSKYVLECIKNKSQNVIKTAANCKRTVNRK